jgi:hypothetical protein
MQSSEKYQHTCLPAQARLQYRDNISKDAIVIADGNLIRSVTWHLNRDDNYMNSENELLYGMEHPDAHDHLLAIEAFRALIKKNADCVVLIACENECTEKYFRSSPERTITQIWGAFRFWCFLPAYQTELYGTRS